MNIELLLRQFLYKNKSVAYPGIGKLVFGGNIQLPASEDKPEVFSLQDLVFTFNLQQEIDPEFVAFVSAQTGKIKPLAAADVESYFMLSKQFINIGKSFVVDGIGSVDKQDNGTFAFTPGYYLPVSEASAAPHKPLKIREAVPVMPKTETKRQAPAINKKIIYVALGIIVLGLASWGIYHLISTKKDTTAGDLPIAARDTNTTSQPKDTTTTTPSVTPAITPAILVPGSFKAIVDQRYTRMAATARAAKLRTYGHDAMVDSVAPATFIIFIPVKDTTISIDTLQLSKITGKRPRFITM